MSVQSEVPGMNRDAKGKRPHFFETPGLDQAMSMIMVLAEELSVLTDHVDLLERAAAAQGIDLAGGVTQVQLDQEALEAREARRQAFLGRLFYLMRKEAAEAAAQDSSENYHRIIDEIAVG